MCLLRDKQIQYRCVFVERCSYFSFELCSVLRLMKSVLLGFYWKFCNISTKECVATLNYILEHQSKLSVNQQGLKQMYFPKWWGALKCRIMSPEWLCWAHKLTLYKDLHWETWKNGLRNSVTPSHFVINLSKPPQCHIKHIWREEHIVLVY